MILAWLLLPPAPALAVDELPLAVDLAADGRQAQEAGQVLLILFSRAGCSWCDQARRSSLSALARDETRGDRLIVRQINEDSRAPLIDFAGRKTTHQAYARSQKVRMVPTVLFLAADGTPLAEPLVGFQGGSDFYDLHVERGLDAARTRLSERK